MSQPWPVEIRLVRDKKALHVAFEDGRAATLPAELLRVESPSAEVQGHGPGERKLVAGKRDVAIASIEPIGNYAVRLVFDDGHSTGIYGWTLLAKLAEDPAARLAGYHRELAAAGLSSAP
ncbi:DUF971 domain-containing protein [Enterovirga sp.]|uniref:DUF971 domain-containing protein n=1 Tax=Enterovirga sp. TaxID=2026350 RepID=UPI002BFCDAD5|nr:DUF971 domain-containing protein [Enterovirga sp.]HMO28717.1 DUF971 domain-containing protein [Enterovirga sp.]